MSLKGRRRRGLTAEDRAIWERVARTARPLRVAPGVKPPKPAADALVPPQRETQAPTESRDPAPTDPPRVTKPSGRPQTAARLGFSDHRPGPVGRPEPGLDRRTADRLRRGDRAPDARIDLHGLTAERAHARLDAFIAQAIRARHRCVLVITGKGGRRAHDEDASYMAPQGGVLREAVPKWLRSGPFARQIVGIYEAHQRHGGGGAVYVYLKKPG